MAVVSIDLDPSGGASLPLYLQVKHRLIKEMVAGEWPPGSILPSEQQLGLRMGVSQGTVRKALDALAAENLVVRQQGRGTFVAQHDQRRTLFQFFKIANDKGERKFPETVFSSLSLDQPTEDERATLGIPSNGKLWRIYRHRSLNEEVVLTERIALAEHKFPDLDVHDPLPNNIYRLYERHYNMSVARAVEKLRAVKVSKEDAAALGCRAGDPVLQIDRLARGLENEPIEIRRSTCLTSKFCYLSDLY